MCRINIKLLWAFECIGFCLVFGLNLELCVVEAGQRDGHLADQMCLVGIVGDDNTLKIGANRIDNLVAAALECDVQISLLLDMGRKDLLCYLEALDARHLQPIEAVLVYAIGEALVARG